MWFLSFSFLFFQLPESVTPTFNKVLEILLGHQLEFTFYETEGDRNHQSALEKAKSKVKLFGLVGSRSPRNQRINNKILFKIQQSSLGEEKIEKEMLCWP